MVVSTPPKQLALALSSSSYVVISPTQPMGEGPHASGGDAALRYSSEQGDHPPITFLLSPLAPVVHSDVAMTELLELPRSVQRPPPARPEVYLEEYRKLYSPQENWEYRSFRDTV